MKGEKIKILAVNPGPKYLGLAMFKDVELVYWAIKKLRSEEMSRSQLFAKVGQIVGTLVSDYKPDFMVIGEPAPRRIKDSPALKGIAARIKSMGKRKVRRVYIFPALKVRKHLCQGEKPTKMNVGRIIVTRYYPWLYHRYEKDRRKDEKGQWWKRKYHTCLFDAVALGIYGYQKLNKKLS
jgi:RNase H-fold protein (predicted Holliday junction resolvase)